MRPTEPTVQDKDELSELVELDEMCVQDEALEQDRPSVEDEGRDWSRHLTDR